MSIGRSVVRMYDESVLRELVEEFEKSDVMDDRMLWLIRELAESGEKIDIPGRVFDFASTGGPSSLSTLLVPLYLYGFGVNVVNLAVPGRPAGAVDVLAQIEGYNLNVFNDFRNAKTPFYIHLEVNERIVPLDKELFDFRRRINKVNIPNLAIASILSKKVAAGASNIGLDVRVSKFGNFGCDWETCRKNAKKFNRLANLLGMNSFCFLSDANIPYQGYIGRGEALEALYDIFNGREDDQLKRHKEYCREMAYRLVCEAGIFFNDEEMDIKAVFEKNLKIQGSTYDCFLDAVVRVKKQPHYNIYADGDGYIQYDLKEIRDYIVSRQRGAKDDGRYADCCGIRLLCDTGTYVKKGTPIMSVRSMIDVDQTEMKKMYICLEQSTDSNERREVI